MSMALRQRGSGWLEFAVAACVIGVLAWFWSSALVNMQADSEKALVDQTIRSIRTGMQLQLTDLMLHDRVREIPALVGQNPVQWLAQPPEGYLGELDLPPPDPAPRSWYFDRRLRALVFLPGDKTGDDGKIPHAAWRVMPGSGSGVGGMAGIRLAPVIVELSR